MKRFQGDRAVIGASALAFVLGLLPIWLSSREMWDGVIGMNALARGDSFALRYWLLDSNWYVSWVILQAANLAEKSFGLPIWMFCKGWITLMALGIAWQSSRLATALFEVEGRFAAWVFPLILAFPVWYIFFSFIPMIGHLSCVFLAVLGYRWYLRPSIAYGVAGLILIGVSVQLPSTAPFLVILEAGRWWMGRGLRSAPRALFLCLVCVGVFFAMRVIWPPNTLYTGYNAVKSPLAAGSWIAYARSAAMFATWGLLLAPIALAWAAGRRNAPLVSGAQAFIGPAGPSDRGVFVLFAVAAAACAPYIAVALGSPLISPSWGGSSVSAALASIDAGNLPVTVWYGGWGARHVLLVMVPLVWLVVWTAVRSRYGMATIACTWLLFLAFTVPGHWAKLHRIAQERSFLNLLTSIPAPPNGKLDIILARPVDYLNVLYESNALLARAYGRTSWVSIMVPDHPVLLAWAAQDRAAVLLHPQREIVRSQQVMNDFDWSRNCRTVAKVALPQPAFIDVLWRAEHAPASLPKAVLTLVSGDCPDAVAPWR